MDLGIEGKRAAVSGASAGLGYATAEALAQEGVHVAICGRDRARIEAAAAKIGANAIPLACDVSTIAGARDFVAQARDALGGVDILVANGGGPAPGAASDTDVESLRGWMEQCFLALMEMCQAAIPGMREQEWGRVLAITTIGVASPLPNMVYSNTARAAFTAYLNMMSKEAARDGVTINSLLPGAHATERLTSMVGPDAIDAIGANNPTGRIGAAADFGRIAAFMCSQWANYVSGAALPVSGGANGV